VLDPFQLHPGWRTQQDVFSSHESSDTPCMAHRKSARNVAVEVGIHAGLRAQAEEPEPRDWEDLTGALGPAADGTRDYFLAAFAVARGMRQSWKGSFSLNPRAVRLAIDAGRRAAYCGHGLDR